MRALIDLMIQRNPLRAPSAPRVVHFMDVCFHRTETFVYDFVRGCRRCEAWCVANRLEPQPGWDFRRVRSVRCGWRREPHWALLNRVFGPLLGRANLRLYWSLRRIDPAVIHAHFGPAGWEVLAYARDLGIPLLTSFYGYDASALPRQTGWAERLAQLFAAGSGFLVEGPAMARRLEGLGCPPTRVHLLPITTDVDGYPFRERRLEGSEALRLLFVGRFVPKKGLPVLLRALGLARHDLGPFALRVIGGGEGEAEARRLTTELAIEDRVLFLGFRPRSEVIAEMDRAHVLAVPSVTAPDGDTEGGAPTILLEAQASGLPVLGSDHADIPFVVAPPYRPYLAPEGSAEVLANRLLALRADAGRWPEFAAAGRAHVRAQHGPDNFRRLEELYERAVRDDL
jgi:colanic acid/amylovoran biosynthesis glycosyltransferase